MGGEFVTVCTGDNGGDARLFWGLFGDCWVLGIDYPLFAFAHFISMTPATAPAAEKTALLPAAAVAEEEEEEFFDTLEEFVDVDASQNFLPSRTRSPASIYEDAPSAPPSRPNSPTPTDVGKSRLTLNETPQERIKRLHAQFQQMAAYALTKNKKVKTAWKKEKVYAKVRRWDGLRGPAPRKTNWENVKLFFRAPCCREERQ